MPVASPSVSSEDASPEQDPGADPTRPPAPSAVGRHLHVGALAAYRRLPLRLKRFVSGRLTPSFQVAAGSVVQRADGAVLLVRHSYRTDWGLPGGFLKRDEHPADAASREAFEELGIGIGIRGQPVVIIVPEERRILVAFRAQLAAVDGEGEAVFQPQPRSPEITEVEWFPVDDLPPLQDDVDRAIQELGLYRS